MPLIFSKPDNTKPVRRPGDGAEVVPWDGEAWIGWLWDGEQMQPPPGPDVGGGGDDD